MSTPEERARRAAYMRDWNRRNPDKVKASRDRRIDRSHEYDRQRYLKNREALLAKKKAEKVADPDKFKRRDEEQYWKNHQHKLAKRREYHYRQMATREPEPDRARFSAFDDIGEEEAYWIGMLMADGCIHENTVILSLHERDIAHVEKFSRFLNSENKISRGFGAATARITSSPSRASMSTSHG